MEKFTDNFYSYGFAGYLVEDDGNEFENEVNFDKIAIISKGDSKDKSE